MNIFVIISFNICWEKQLGKFGDQRTLFSHSKDFAVFNFSCNLVVDNLTALLPLMDCNHLINKPPLLHNNYNRSKCLGKFWLKSDQSKKR